MKIPRKYKGTGVSIHRWHIFNTDCIVTAARIVTRLERKEKCKGLQAYGQITVDGRRYHYARYVYFQRPEIFTDNKN